LPVIDRKGYTKENDLKLIVDVAGDITKPPSIENGIHIMGENLVSDSIPILCLPWLFIGFSA
jgi:hypothetical protein